MSQKQKILVVDDEHNICELLRLYLEKEGFQVSIARDGNSALEAIRRDDPDLVLLDIMIPAPDGWQVCRRVRESGGTVPIIMLTAKGETFDKIMGLELGADDYIVKPFDSKEVIARIKAVLRRADKAPEEVEVSADNLSINIANYELRVGGKLVEAPPKEIELLFYLVKNAGRVFNRDQLLNDIWGFEYFGDSRTVDVHIKRLREKLEGVSDKWELKTVWGVGYKFEIKE